MHKSQGSEFTTTFVVLPARVNVSRELMYTALTRQLNKVVILHEGTLSDLRALAAPERSETARRLTDLFVPPEPVTVQLRGKALRFDRRLIHVSANGILMASKNEVIIAGLLDRLVPGQWEYERVLQGNDGREVRPDFTIQTPDGRTVFWEHAGMLDRPDYARKWDLKKQWYIDNRILPFEQSPQGGPVGVLMWTDDLNGADAAAWLAYGAKVLNVEPAALPAEQTPTQRRVVKKTSPRALSRDRDMSG